MEKHSFSAHNPGVIYSAFLEVRRNGVQYVKYDTSLGDAAEANRAASPARVSAESNSAKFVVPRSVEKKTFFQSPSLTSRPVEHGKWNASQVRHSPSSELPIKSKQHGRCPTACSKGQSRRA